MKEETKVDWLTIAYEQAQEADTQISELEAEIRELNSRIINYQDQIQNLVREKYRRINRDSNN